MKMKMKIDSRLRGNDERRGRNDDWDEYDDGRDDLRGNDDWRDVLLLFNITNSFAIGGGSNFLFDLLPLVFNLIEIGRFAF